MLFLGPLLVLPCVIKTSESTSVHTFLLSLIVSFSRCSHETASRGDVRPTKAPLLAIFILIQLSTAAYLLLLTAGLSPFPWPLTLHCMLLAKFKPRSLPSPTNKLPTGPGYLSSQTPLYYPLWRASQGSHVSVNPRGITQRWRLKIGLILLTRVLAGRLRQRAVQTA